MANVFQKISPIFIKFIEKKDTKTKRRKMMEEEEGGRMAEAAVYPNVYVIQSCSL